MNGPQFQRRTCRPRDHVAAASRLYLDAWHAVDFHRQHRGEGNPTWPDWCYLPMQAYAQIVADDARVPIQLLGLTYPERVADAARLAALGAWRVTQGIYRFDPAVYDAVRSTAVGDLPADVLYRLPEWCVYLETPGMVAHGEALHGVFAHLEYDTAAEGRHELRLLFDADKALVPVPLHLGAWSLGAAIERVVGVAERHASAAGVTLPPAADAVRALAPVVEPVVSLLLYLCSQASEIGDGTRRPTNPRPIRTKRGWRLFPADRPTTWDVGVRMGAALRRAYHAEQTGAGDGEAERAGPRPHIRRAHWHGFRVGPTKRDDGSEIPAAERRFDLRWLPPIAVNLPDVEGLPAVVRPVR